MGGGIECPPPSQISSCASGIDFWVALKWWQFISVHILLCYFPSRVKNYIEKVTRVYTFMCIHVFLYSSKKLSVNLLSSSAPAPLCSNLWIPHLKSQFRNKRSRVDAKISVHPPYLPMCQPPTTLNSFAMLF